MTALPSRLAPGRPLMTLLALLSASALAAPAEETLRLKFQAAGGNAAGSLQVQFIGYRDQRCPVNVQCITAGTAQALFWVQPAEGAGQVLTLPWPAAEPVKAGGYSLQLKSLEPRPNTRKPPNPADYEAVLTLQKLAGKP
ncbi:hypothetical protein ACS5PK_18345 [Roseateles sp. DB2]|uniref:hypothetical protein n=1 Tax=Roseateles sp. DB2 TaxID=3453717 RepID=UPI003EF028AC